MATTTQKVEAVGVTLTGAAVGFFVAGPVGLGIGLTLGAIADLLILKAKKDAPEPPPPPGTDTLPIVAAAMVPGAAGLPPGADKNAAAQATLLMQTAFNTGHSFETKPAKTWLTKFQTSVGLPATGALDPATRAMLVLAAPAAANLPAVTVLG